MRFLLLINLISLLIGSQIMIIPVYAQSDDISIQVSLQTLDRETVDYDNPVDPYQVISMSTEIRSNKVDGNITNIDVIITATLRDIDVTSDPSENIKDDVYKDAYWIKKNNYHIQKIHPREIIEFNNSIYFRTAGEWKLFINIYIPNIDEHDVCEETIWVKKKMDDNYKVIDISTMSLAILIVLIIYYKKKIKKG